MAATTGSRVGLCAATRSGGGMRRLAAAESVPLDRPARPRAQDAGEQRDAAYVPGNARDTRRGQRGGWDCSEPEGEGTRQ